MHHTVSFILSFESWSPRDRQASKEGGKRRNKTVEVNCFLPLYQLLVISLPFPISQFHSHTPLPPPGRRPCQRQFVFVPFLPFLPLPFTSHSLHSTSSHSVLTRINFTHSANLARSPQNRFPSHQPNDNAAYLNSVVYFLHVKFPSCL